MAAMAPSRPRNFAPDAHRDADDVRPRHELADAHDVDEFRIAQPSAPLDGDAVRPGDAAAGGE